MKTIYELQQIADRLRASMEVNSISPEDTFGLQADVLEYLADMEQNAEGLGIHQVYASYAAMLADASSPVGSNGKPLRFGQLVVIYDSSNTTQAESGNVYAWQKGQTGASAWKLMGNLGSVYALQRQIDSLLSSLADEENARKSADNDLSSRINALQDSLNNLLGGDLSTAIDTFNEVTAFLEGISDDESLTGLLSELGTRIDNIGARFIDLANYMRKGIELPANCVYLYAGDPVESRIYSMNDGETYWLAFCLQKGDTNENHFGVGVKDCVVYSAKSRTDRYIFDGRYYGDDVPVHVQKAFGYALASQDNAGLMSAEDKAKLDGLQNMRHVIMISLWDDEEPGIMIDTVNKAGIYYFKYDTKELYVTDNVPAFVKTPLEDDVIYVRKDKNIPYIWKDNDMHPIAPENIPASIFNATNEIPIRGYYVLCDDTNQEMSAVHAAWKAGKSVSGLIISFEIGAGIWKTYQYIGKTVTETNWVNEDNWKDFGSLAAGSEPYIIIDSLVGASGVGSYYTLATAVQALVAYQDRTKVTYAKKGLIISYSIGENQMETKQFQGEVSDFGEVGLWKDFGGGSKVETSDTPEEGGQDALSTGGAYEHIPATLSVDTETEGTIKLRM
ncbi:MAG: hypothetical protein SPH53_06340, partial [Bacteroidaceae bacterium]|nr:hypothetical protein [Bacteroidaceae bacterium]